MSGGQDRRQVFCFNFPRPPWRIKRVETFRLTLREMTIPSAGAAMIEWLRSPTRPPVACDATTRPQARRTLPGSPRW